MDISTPTPTRKSKRQRVPNRKYSIEGFESLDILGSDSEHDLVLLEKSERRAARGDEDGHDDFSGDDPMVAESILEEEDDDEDIMSAQESSDGSPVVTPEENDNEVIDSDDLAVVDHARPGSKRRRRVVDENVRSRGMGDNTHKLARSNDLLFVEHIVGSNEKDHAFFHRTRDRWGRIISLPTKRLNKDGEGGMDYPLNYSAEQRQMEATVGWDWYYDEGGKATFQARQVLEPLGAVLGSSKYVPRPAKDSHSVLMGPYPKQRLFTIPLMQSLNLDEAWKLARTTSPTDPDGIDQRSHKSRQDGWVLSVGTSVQCLEWAPNHLHTQYLAISTLPSREPRSEQPPSVAPAYTASPPNPSCIQIWALTSSEISGKAITLPPELRMVICTEWGHAKQLKWCPMPRDPRGSASDNRTYLGLLAGVWSDGYLRVLDIYMDNERGSDTRYVKYSTVAFESRPPETLCTCVTWLSPTDIAAGCANGYLAVWNIFPQKPVQSLARNPHSSEPERARTNARPYIYFPIHHSYVLAITSAYPPYPQYLCTTSMSGHMRLTDIRNPTADTVYAQHTRYGPSSVAYCAHLNCFTATHEDSDFIRAWPLRRFWGTLGLARGESELLSISAAPFHPTMLAGFADGTLLAFNPLKRYLGGKVPGGQPQQQVWKHEWAQSKQSSMIKQDKRRGISRITEGYKVVYQVLHPEWDEPRRGFRRARIDDVKPLATIHEGESAVRQVTWNPNRAWGGWAAAGMGSGLVRIEDLSI